MKSELAEKLKNRKHSFILIIAVIACICYVVIMWVNLGSGIKERKKTFNQLSAQYEAQLNENEELESELKDGISDAEKEYIARNELGYILPGEHVYADASSGS